MKVTKRDGKEVRFSQKKIEKALRSAFKSVSTTYDPNILNRVISQLFDYSEDDKRIERYPNITVEQIQDIVEEELMLLYPRVARAYIIYRENHRVLRDFVRSKEEFIDKYKQSGNTADATIDDNSNVACKNIGVLNNEIHKADNLQISRGMVMRKLDELYPEFDSKQYLKDLEHHIIYKHDESSFAGAIAPYCCSVSMYPFLTEGIKNIGGLSAAPKRLGSYCGMYINMIFAISSQFAGAVATSEFLLYFDYFARKEWGDDYYKNCDELITAGIDATQKTIKKQIHQYFQQVIYSINQPAAARGMQSAFINFSYFDKPFFEGMFGHFRFPDGSAPVWESLCWLQKDFMQWFNQERLRCMLTFPVESFALVYKDGQFVDQDSADFVAEEYARGHSFFTYISDTVDSLSSCCRLKNKVTTKEFNFTNGNMGIQTGSKSVITLNLNRIIQDWSRHEKTEHTLPEYLTEILDRVYKYHTAYNELLWDMYNANLLPTYKAGFINLNKQYLTIGINGLNEAAEFLGIECSDNEKYQSFCQQIFSTIKEQNQTHKTSKTTYNTECVPAESLAIKNYNWDKADGYWVPKDRNLYASYIFIPSKQNSIIERIRMHGKNYIGDYLDGGSAAHLNLAEHLSKEQYQHILKYAAEEGCQYLTFNIPNQTCKCGFIAKQPFDKCPKCGATEGFTLYDRVIGYLTAIPSWSEGRRKEQQMRIYNSSNEIN